MMVLNPEQIKELAEKMRFAAGFGISPLMAQGVARAARMQETVLKIALAAGRPADEVSKELQSWIQSHVFTTDEMLPIAYRNVKTALPMTRLPRFKQMEIETGMKGIVTGDGYYHTWEEIIPFEW